LRLMSFDEVHDWLAPTGHVDAYTAFGGEKAFESWRSMRRDRLQCYHHLPVSLQQLLTSRAHPGNVLFTLITFASNSALGFP